MATKLFLRETTLNGIGTFRDMVTTAGASLTTGVVNTAISGTNIQWTKTAGGSVLEWISGRSPAGGWTLSGTMTFNIWAQESNMTANCGGRARYYKRTAGGTETEIATSPADDGVEFGTARAAMNWTEVPTSTAFAENDRLVVRYFITNIGTMSGGFTCTMAYDAATGGADGDSWVQINETITFKVEDQNLAPSLFTNSQTFHSATVLSTSTLTPSLFTNTNTFFTPTVSSTYDLAPALFTNTTTFFTPQIDLIIFPNLFTNTQTFFSATVAGAGADQNLAPSLFTNTQSFFTPTVSATYALAPALFTNTNTFFTPQLNLTILPGLFTNTNVFFSPTVATTYSLLPSIFTNTQTFFSPRLDFIIFPNLFTNSQSFFSATVGQGGTQEIFPSLFVNENIFELGDPDFFFSPTITLGEPSVGRIVNPFIASMGVMTVRDGA